MKISDLVKTRPFQQIRRTAEDFLALEASWARARRYGGKKELADSLKSVLDKHGSLGTRALQSVSERMPGLAKMLPSGISALPMMPDICAGAVCGSADGSYEEERRLQDMYSRLSKLVEDVPLYGDESVAELQNDTALVEKLASVEEAYARVQTGGPKSPVAGYLKLLG